MRSRYNKTEKVLAPRIGECSFMREKTILGKMFVCDVHRKLKVAENKLKEGRILGGDESPRRICSSFP